MSTPETTGPGRPLRNAGLALLAIAGISLLIALVTWLDSGGDDNTSASGPATEAPSATASSPSADPTANDPAAPPTSSAVPGTQRAPGQPGGAPQSGDAAEPEGSGQPNAAAETGEPGGSAQPRPPDDGAAAQPGGGGRPAPGGEARPAPGGESGGSSAGGGASGVERAELRVYNNSTIKGLAARAADDFSSGGWSVVEVGNYSGGRIPTSTVYYQPGTGQQGSAEALGEQFDLRVEPRFAGIRNSAPGVIVIVTNDYQG